MKKYILFGIAFAICAANAKAADWEYLESTKTSLVFIDQSSISSASPYKKAWIMYDYTEPQQLIGYPARQYQSSLALQYVDCGARSIAMKQDLKYAERAKLGEVLSSYSYPIAPASFNEVVPDSVGEAILERICKSVKKK